MPIFFVVGVSNACRRVFTDPRANCGVSKGALQPVTGPPELSHAFKYKSLKLPAQSLETSCGSSATFKPLSADKLHSQTGEVTRF